MRWSDGPGVKRHVSRGDAPTCMVRYALVVGIYGTGVLAADTIEINAADFDIGAAVAGPFCIHVHLGVHVRRRCLGVICVHIADYVHVGVAVQL